MKDDDLNHKSGARPEDMMMFMDEEGAQEEKSASDAAADSVWRILITDDERDVHSATTFALRNTKIMGRALEFYHADSAQKALKVLREVKDIAVIMLDVVMETPNAGLDLVAVIREDLKITDSRIILRTGQPNQAPEIEVIRDYDINDYKLKSELTQSKLYASLTTAVRSYKQIRMIEAGKKGLDMIVRSSSELLTKKGLNAFAQGVIVHLSGLLSIPPEGLICVRRRIGEKQCSTQIIAAAGHYCALIDHPLSDLVESEAVEVLNQSLDGRCNVYHKHGIALYLGSDERGDMSCYVSSVSKIHDVDQGLLELFCSNISICADNLSLMERLSNYAYYDPLVGLPNRNLLTEEIDRILDKTDLPPYSLALVDVDSFAEINAALGQQYGDKLLKAVGQRLTKRFPVPSTVARVSGDTFAVVGPTSHITEKSLLDPFSSAFEMGAEEQIITVTAGIVPLAETDGGGSEAIKDASIVLKLAKHQSRGEVITFSGDMLNDARERLEMLKDLRTAFESGALHLAYQPKFNLESSEVTGFEALVRWRKGENELIDPENFIPLAEQSGLIVRMGEWIFDSAIQELRRLHKSGWDKAQMSLNLSVVQVHHGKFLSMLKGIVDKYGVDPKFIELELTESVAMSDASSNVDLLHQIKEMGFSLSLDDFGTGFSSLSYLQRMPIDRLKIDQSFVHTSHEKSGREIVEMIVHLGRTLGLGVVAEGVENLEQVKILKSMNCDEVQGFLYAKPMTGDELSTWLEQNYSN